MQFKYTPEIKLLMGIALFVNSSCKMLCITEGLQEAVSSNITFSYCLFEIWAALCKSVLRAYDG